MGAGNSKAVYAVWHGLSHAQARMLNYMALVSLDNDVPPVFYGGRGSLALSIGRPLPPEDDENPDVTRERKAAYKAVERVLAELKAVGAIELIRTQGPGTPARYALNLTGPHPSSNGGRTTRAQRGQKAPSPPEEDTQSADSTPPAERTNNPRSADEHPPPNGSTPPAQRGQQEEEEEGGLSRGVGGWSSRQPSGVAHARESGEQTRQRQQSEVVGFIDAQGAKLAQDKPQRPPAPTCDCGTVLDPDGSCFVCRTAS